MPTPEAQLAKTAGTGPTSAASWRWTAFWTWRGPGRVVLTTVSHLNNFVFNLTLQNAAGQTDTLGVTGYHKFYDQAEGWQSVVDLTVGDTLRGRDGQTVTV